MISFIETSTPISSSSYLISSRLQIACQDSFQVVEYLVERLNHDDAIYSLKLYGMVSDSVFEFVYAHKTNVPLDTLRKNAVRCKNLLVFHCDN